MKLLKNMAARVRHAIARANAPSALTVHLHEYAHGAVVAPPEVIAEFRKHGYAVAFDAWRFGFGEGGGKTALTIMENRIANCAVFWYPTKDDAERLPICAEDIAPAVARYLPASHAVVYASPTSHVDPMLLRHEAKHACTRVYSHAGPLFDNDPYATP